MAIARNRNEQKEVIRSDIQVEPEAYNSPVVDTKRVNVDSMTTYLPGRALTCDYYKQRRGQNDELRPYQLGLSPTLQNYRVIRGMELRTTGDLTDRQDETSKEMTSIGSASVYPHSVVPDHGDLIVLDMGNGMEGLFTVISSSKLNPYPTTAFDIEYELIGEMNDAYREDLRRKTAEVFVWDLNRLRRGFDPVITEQSAAIRDRIDSQYTRLLSLFMQGAFSREMHTLIVPNQPRITYDPFITRFILNVVESIDHPYMQHLRTLNVSGDAATYEFTLWNALEQVDKSVLSLAADRMGLVKAADFHYGKFFQSAYYSKAERIVYPMMQPTGADTPYFGQLKRPTTPDTVRGWARFAELDRLIPVTELVTDRLDGPTYEEPDHRAPNIHRVVKDDYYVFTEAFYRHEQMPSALSKLETLVWDTLLDRAMDLNVLNALCVDALRWDNLERFYYIPVLLYLIRMSNNNLR